MSNCYIHIGTHKTGTSAIQSFCSQNADWLMSEGFFYGNTGKFEAHHGLAVFIRDFARSMNDNDRVRVVAALETLKEMANGRDVLISSEMLCENKAFTGLGVLEELFEEITIIVYLRRQDLMLESSYNQVIKQNGEHAAIDSVRYYFIDYLEFIRSIENSFVSNVNIVARIYDRSHFPNGSVVEDFVGAIGIKSIVPPGGEKIVNESLNIAALECVRVLNRHGLNSNPALVQRIATVAQRIYPYAEQRALGNYFNAKERAAILDEVRASNEELRMKYLPTLPAPLFKEDFAQTDFLRKDMPIEKALEILITAVTEGG